MGAFSKLGNSIRAQFNKMANWFWTKDPIAQMQLEYDRAVDQMKDGRQGLEQYRALVEKVQRQVVLNKKAIAQVEAKIRAYLKVGDRATAGQLAIQLQKHQSELAENEEQLSMHEKAYNNNVKKIKNATKKLADVREKIKKYEADLKMSEAEAEIAQLSRTFNFDVTTDFGELENIVQEKIDLNRAKVRVAADLSDEGIEQIEAEERMEEAMAEGEAETASGEGPAVLITAREGWHPGIVGLLASRLKERFSRPVIAIAFDRNGKGTGSGRSIGGVDLGAAVRGAVDAGVLEKGGGHAMAAGLTVDQGKLGALRAYMEEALADAVGKARAVHTLKIDAALSARAATLELVDLS